MAKEYNHLALVRRDEVVELFKNSIIFPQSSIPFDGSIEALADDTELVLGVFNLKRNNKRNNKKWISIEYSTNYFLLHIVSKGKSLSKGLEITDLVSIIPLDEDAYRMGLSLIPEVKLECPIFSVIYGEYQKKAEVENALKGVDNIRRIFGFSNLWGSIKGFSKEESLPKLVSMIMDGTNNRQPKSIWECLLTYTRSHNYPNDIRGAFLDTMSVVRNYSSNASIDEKETKSGKSILECEKPSYNSLVSCLGTSARFVETANKGYKDFWRIAPIYFILLDELSNASEDGTQISGKPTQEFVASSKKIYGRKNITRQKKLPLQDITDENNEEPYNFKYLKPALLMLGITLGQSSTYKLLYAVLKPELPFLK